MKRRVAMLLVGALLSVGLIGSPASAFPQRPDYRHLDDIEYTVSVARDAVTSLPMTFLAGKTGGSCKVHILVRSKGPYMIISRTIQSGARTGYFETFWEGAISLWIVEVSDCKPLA